jgi:hypothetical protein
MNDNEEHVSDREMAGEVQPCCEGRDCCPPGSESGCKSWKTLISILVLLAAGAVLAHSFIGKSDADGEQSRQAFAPIRMDNMSDTPSPARDAVKAEIPVESDSRIETPPVADDTRDQGIPGKAAPSLWKAELDSLASLNKVAANTDAVFILLSAKDQQDDQTITKEIDAAAQKIQANGVRVSAFRLRQGAPEYAQLSKQVSIPCVLAMVKGGGMSAVSGEISEAKLVQAFVTASRPTSGCCPPGSGAVCPPQK